MSLADVAELTGKSVATVQAYSRWPAFTREEGARRPKPEWEAGVIRLAEERIAQPTEATA